MLQREKELEREREREREGGGSGGQYNYPSLFESTGIKKKPLKW